jgi:hypothetical protein
LPSDVSLLPEVRSLLGDVQDRPRISSEEVAGLHQELVDRGATVQRTVRQIAQDIAALAVGQEPPRVRGAGFLDSLLKPALPITTKSGAFHFANLSSAKPEFVEKAAQILNLLSSHVGIEDFLGIGHARITLENRDLETPADVRPDGQGGYEVRLAAYYFEKYSIGYVAGMLAHEQVAADPGRSASGRRGWSLPRATEVGCQRSSEAWLGVGGEGRPGPSVGCFGVRTFGEVQPRVCLNRRKVCSMSKRRRYVCQRRSASSGVASMPDHHSQTGFGVAPLGRWSMSRRITVPSTMGRVPSAAAQESGGSAWGAGGSRCGPSRCRRGGCR